MKATFFTLITQTTDFSQLNEGNYFDSNYKDVYPTLMEKIYTKISWC